MQVLFTLSKQLEDRKSTWRFIKVDEGYAAVGGNYKLVSYRSESAMQKSKQWFIDKGYAVA